MNNYYKDLRRTEITIHEMVAGANNTARINGLNISKSNIQSFDDMIKHIKLELKEVKKAEKPWVMKTYSSTAYDPNSFEAELADIVIRIASYCGLEHIDLERAIIEKMEYNQTRNYK